MSSRVKDAAFILNNEEQEELLVFGYSCKLFRDDERALFIDQGKHLIPWMGDETLKIDRYDGRGTLYDLAPCEPIPGGFDRFFGLTDAEKQVEQLCDEERYRALHSNEEEEAMYQEEELKRLHKALNDGGNSYGQVGYSYNENKQTMEMPVPNNGINMEKMDQDMTNDEPFLPSPLLDIPKNMVLPETVKHNAIIEKTAMFISSQGLQMEILLKIKQSGNSQFDFLSFDNELYPYYKHLITIIKTGRYKPVLDAQDSQIDMDTEDGLTDHYLHPSLVQSVSKVELAPSIPSISYKPSADCAYTMLVSKIRQKNVGAAASEDEEVGRQRRRVSTLKSASARFQLRHSAESASEANVSKPPSDAQLIIDKMASYVAKNGRDFENIVKNKGDVRFEFLQPGHVHHDYYLCKLEQYTVQARSEDGGGEDRSKLTPVCFSIKKPRESEKKTVIDKSALPVEESTSEEEEEESGGGSDHTEQAPVDVVPSAPPTPPATVPPPPVVVDLAAAEDKLEKNKKLMATERAKDKLTAAVREKVAQMSKEKQVQLERKRRVAAFLKNVKPSDVVCPVYGPVLPGDSGVQRIENDNEDDEVHSLPDLFCDVDVNDTAQPSPARTKQTLVSKNRKEKEEKSRGHESKLTKHKDREKCEKRKVEEHVITLDDSSGASENGCSNSVRKRKKCDRERREKKKYRKKDKKSGRSRSDSRHKYNSDDDGDNSHSDDVTGDNSHRSSKYHHSRHRHHRHHHSHHK